MHNKLRISPCILVIAKIHVDRAVSYVKSDEETQLLPDGSEETHWKTERLFKNRAEAKAAQGLYQKVREKLRSFCVKTEIGFVCSEAHAGDLDTAIAEAHQMISDANATFTHCSVTFKIVCTKLEPTNDAGADMLKETLNRTTQELRDAMAAFDLQRAKLALNSTKQFLDVLADPTVKDSLVTMRSDAKDLIGEIAGIVKQFDGDVSNALASPQATAVLARTQAPWSF
jgi:hypothetical protein